MAPPRSSTLEAMREAALAGRPFGAEAYTDEVHFALERSKIFDDAWVAAASFDAASEPGAWVRLAELDPRLVLVCGADLERRALFDVCRHRGAPLLPDDRTGRASSLCFECPYHGWRYRLDGALFAARDEARASLVGAWCRLHAAQWWVQMKRARRTNEIGLPSWLVSLERTPLVRVRSARWQVRANWKIVVENFQESHHFERMHPVLERLTPWRRSCSGGDAEARWLSGEMPLEASVETVSESGLRRGRRFIVEDAHEQRRVRDAYVFPNALYSRQPDYLLVYRFFATHVDHTTLECDTLVHPESARAAARDGLDEVFAFWDRVHDEDRIICEGVQRCARSRGFAPATFDPSEDGVRAFDAMVLRVLGEDEGSPSMR